MVAFVILIYEIGCALIYASLTLTSQADMHICVLLELEQVFHLFSRHRNHVYENRKGKQASDLYLL